MWAVPAFALTAFALIWFYRSSTYRMFDDPLVSTIQSLISYVEVDPEDGRIVLSDEPIDPNYQRALSGRYWVVGELDGEGRLIPVMGSPSLYGATLILPQEDAAKITRELGEVVTTLSIGPDREPLRLAAQAVIFSDLSDQPFVIAAAADRRPAVKAVRQFSLIALGLMSLLALGLVSAIYMQVRLGLRPLFDLRRRVADVREGNARKVAGNYPKEIMPLADELNTLIGHNKDVVEYARTHVGNLAHALKTPLAVLVNETDDKGTPLAEIVARQSEIMSKQVDHHLRRARAATRGQSIGTRTPIYDTVSSLARTLQKIYRDKDLDIQINIDDSLVFRGEKRDLEEMAGNLLDNACKWTSSHIDVNAHVLSDGPSAIVLTIDDDGPGLAEEQYSIVLQRGARLD